MNKIRFGPSGNQQLFYDDGNKKSVEAPKWLNAKGLNAYEYSCSRGFTISKETAIEIGKQAKLYDILVSIHAPYYINLANPSDMAYESAFNYIKNGLTYLDYFQGKKLVVHPASCGKMDRNEALDRVSVRLKTIIDTLRSEDLIKDKLICLETMGKFLQIGTYEEIINLCKIDECLVPTFDFGHINALSSGKLKTEDDYKKIFDLSIKELGYDRTRKCHIHFSKIEFGKNGGEIRHLDFDDTIYGPEFKPLAKVIIEYKLSPSIICESKTRMATDALEMKNIYYDCLENTRQN